MKLLLIVISAFLTACAGLGRHESYALGEIEKGSPAESLCAKPGAYGEPVLIHVDGTDFKIFFSTKDTLYLFGPPFIPILPTVWLYWRAVPISLFVKPVSKMGPLPEFKLRLGNAGVWLDGEKKSGDEIQFMPQESNLADTLELSVTPAKSDGETFIFKFKRLSNTEYRPLMGLDGERPPGWEPLCGTAPAESPQKLVLVSGDRFIVDLRYHTKDNFLKKDVYSPLHLDACYVLPVVLEKLKILAMQLEKQHLKLVFWDCFRPLSIQRERWKLVPDARYVADPQVGSNHNRGAAIDITLAHEDGSLLDMPTHFDSFEDKAHSDYKCSSDEKLKCDNRALLFSLLGAVGMNPLPTEWWHYQLPDISQYPVRETKD